MNMLHSEELEFTLQPGRDEIPDRSGKFRVALDGGILRDERSAPAVPDQYPIPHEKRERLADGNPADAEAFRQLELARELRPREDLSILDLAPQKVRDLVVVGNEMAGKLALGHANAHFGNSNLVEAGAKNAGPPRE